MIKKLFVSIILVVSLLISCSYVKAAANNDLEISNKYFSITMPNDTKGLYVVMKENNGIDIFEKVSKNAGLIGYAFGLRIYKNPEDYVYSDGCTKVGELTDKNGVIYDMVLERPTDVVLSEGEKVQENFDRLYEVGNNVEIKGINGSKYVKGKGMKGEELYEKVLNKYKTALAQKWSSYEEFKKEDFNSVFYVLAQSKGNLFDKVGYTYYDINSDGIEELIIGKIAKGNSKGMIYDIYTMVNRAPKRVPFTFDKVELFVCNDIFLCYNYSSTKKSGKTTVFGLNKNSTKLYTHNEFSYDKKKKDYDDMMSAYGDYKRFDFVPFSKLK